MLRDARARRMRDTRRIDPASLRFESGVSSGRQVPFDRKPQAKCFHPAFQQTSGVSSYACAFG